MNPKFWVEGASLHIHAAYEAEIAPFIRRHKLKRVPARGQGLIYAHRDIDLRVMINGESGVSCLLMTGMALAQASNHTRHLLIGTSGHATLSVGSWYHPAVLSLNEKSSCRRLYPTLDGACHFESTPHLTRSEFVKDYPHEGGVDLESYYWFQALSRQVSLDSIGIVRLVSDSPAEPLGERIDFKALSSVIDNAWDTHEAELDHWFAFQAKRSSEWLLRERVMDLPKELQAYRWSQTQLVKVRRCVERSLILGFALSDFCKDVKARSLSRNDVLKSLEVQLDEAGVALHG
jgi:hypothetical protein